MTRQSIKVFYGNIMGRITLFQEDFRFYYKLQASVKEHFKIAMHKYVPSIIYALLKPSKFISVKQNMSYSTLCVIFFIVVVLCLFLCVFLFGGFVCKKYLQITPVPDGRHHGDQC